MSAGRSDGGVSDGGVSDRPGRRGPPPLNRDRGGATVFVIAAGLLVILCGAALAGVGAAVVARHRAQAAADLGALAGVPHAAEGEQVACERAAEIVAANRGRLVDCRAEGLDILVTVQVVPSGYAAVAGPARARARAGPARPPR